VASVTYLSNSFGGTVLAEVPISAAPPQKADLKPAKTAPVVAAPAGQGSQAEEAELRKYLANEKKEHHGRERRTGKFFQGSRVLACFFTVIKAWRRHVPTWAVHGTSLSVLRQEATPWDGDADVGFLAEDHAELNEMWNATNMARYVATIPECAGMKADFLNEPHFKGFHGISGAGSFQLDMWDFKLNLDSFDEARTRREWKDKLQLKDNEAILCKWICVRKSDIFPLKPCHISVPLPDKDKPFGQVTRVERVGITCGNRLNEAWAEHYPPYANWNKTSPYNAFNAETKSWEFDLDVWRSFKAGKGDRFVYDSEQRAGSTHVRDLLEGPVIITPPSEVTVASVTYLSNSFGGTMLAEVPISAAP